MNELDAQPAITSPRLSPLTAGVDVVANCRWDARFSAVLSILELSIVVDSIILSNQDFCCLPRFLPLSKGPCKVVFNGVLW